MVTVIDEPPSGMALFGQSLGRGLNQGLSKLLESHNAKQNTEREFKQVRGVLGKIYKEADPFGDIDTETRDDIRGLAQALTQAGLNSDQDSQSAYDFISSRRRQKESAKEDETTLPEQTAPLTSAAGKTLSPTPEVYGQRDEGDSFWERVFKGTGRGAAMQAEMTYQPEALTQIPAGYLKGRTLGAADIAQPETGGGQVFRELASLAGLGKTFGQAKGVIEKVTKPQGALGKVLSASIAGGGISAAEQLIKNGEIDPKQLAFETTVWTGLEGLFLAASPLLKALKGPIETVAKETGQPAQQILKEAAEKSGADLASAVQGDVTEINKLRKSITEAPEVAKRVTETPKETFKEKSAIRQREVFAERVKESPLEEYLAPEKEVAKRPETVAKESEVTQRVSPLVQQKNAEIVKVAQDLRDLKAARRSVPPESQARIEAGIKHAEDVQLPRLRNELADLKYELKNFRKPPTEAEINTQIKKSVDEFAQEIKNPTEEGKKRIARQLELDKKYIENANRLAERGELPGEIRPDTFIKMKKKYLDSYQEAIKALRDEIKSLRGAKDVESVNKMMETRRLADVLDGRMRRLRSDIVSQTDKLKAMQGLKGAPGAFYKQQLKSLRPDVEAFQKDFFRTMKHLKPTEALKVEKVGVKEIQRIGKTIEVARKNPTLENVQKAAEEVGIPKEEINKLTDDIKKDVQEGKSHSQIMKEHRERMENMGEKAETVVKQKTDSSALGKFVKRFFGYTALTGLVSYVLSGGEALTPYQMLKGFKESGEVEEYRKALYSGDREQVKRLRRKYIQKRYSVSKINTIARAAKAKQESENA